MPLLIEFLLFLGVLAASKVFFGWRNGEKKAKRKSPPPPAFPSLPLIGSLPYLRGLNNVPEFLLKSADRLGPIFTIRVGLKEILVLNSKDAIKEAYINHLSSFSGRAHMFVETIINPRRKGLGASVTDDEWKRLNQLSLAILKEFGFGIKNEMEERILTEVDTMVNYVRKMNGQAFTARETIAMIASNVINNIMFGYRLDYKDGIGQLYIEMKRFAEGFDLTFELSSAIRFLPHYRDKLNVLQDSMKTLLDIFKVEVERCKSPDANDCFVKRYLEKEGGSCNEEQLLFTLRDLVGAGSDTTINTLLWSLVAFADNPAVQDRLRTEIDAVVPRHRYPTMNDKNKLPYVEATILELMRWKTLVPLSVPRMTMNDVIVNGYFVPAGTMVLANLYAAHMDAKEWNEPTEFRPERFLDEDNNVFGEDRVIPFSLGRRSCLGEVLARTELFLVVAAIVQNFIILPPEGQDKVNAKPLEPIGLLMPPVSFNIRFIPRM